MNYKLGSLFDGSGGFPLAGALCGIEPSWASEVEPYPIAVTRERFPNMKHLGDISKINGAEVEPVDIITFGSPCQDLSVAGKRAGLKHEANGDEETTRSGLFMEAVRIIKEMREATNGKYPSFALWENVPGAFSSNKGEDFRVVCEELIKIVEPSAFMPPVPKAGWPYADSYVGDEWSLAYRVFDAQYWGVPQRRRRIHLVLDLRGERAREVLFEREGVRGYFAQGGKAWEGTPGNAEGSTGANDREGERSAVGINGDIAGTLDASYFKGCGMRQGVEREVVCVPYTLKIRSGCEGGGKGALIQEVYCIGNGQVAGLHLQEKAGTLDCMHDPKCIVYWDGSQKTGTLTANNAGGNQRMPDKENFNCVIEQREEVAYGVDCQNDKCETLATNNDSLEKCYTLCSRLGTGGNNQPLVVEANEEYPTELHEFIADDNADAPHQQDQLQAADGVSRPLVAATHGAASHHTKTVIYNPPHYIVRRLTPTECARLQGFADCWGYIEPKENLTDEEYRFWLDVRNTHAVINDKPVKEYTVKQMLTWYNKLYTDSAEYKMWGNGIALPPALYCMQGITDALNAYANAGECDRITFPEEIVEEQGRQNSEAVRKVMDFITEEPVEDDLTDLSDAPEEIKEEIMENAEKLEQRTEEETLEEITETTSEAPASFNAIEQLRALAEERKVLAHINTNTPRFENDVLAIEYAVRVLEAVGL